MALCISYRKASTLPVHFPGLVPESIGETSLAEIEQLPILHGRYQVPLAELFKVTGDPSDGRLEFNGDFSHVHGIGTGMMEGCIRVNGNTGRYVGLAMRGGEIHISGDAGDSLGCEMIGGTIRVGGSAGNLVGGARSGSRLGMAGGTILVKGAVGDQAGYRMRRGLIAIGGSAGKLTGYNMLAGTIVVLGKCGARAGAGMKRGTLFLLGESAEELLPTYRSAGTTNAAVLPLIGRHLQSLGFIENMQPFEQNYELFHGDFLTLGRGEILLSS